jgi:amidase
MTGTPVDAFASATVMLHALRKGQVSAVELLDMHLRRIERYNPSLNAIVIQDSERARSTARAADEARAGGADDPLLGLPLTIKDAIDVQGLPTICGIPERAEHRAEIDAPIVARLRQAGAVIIGKTNVPPYTGDWQTTNPVFGRTHNPWDLARTPGGSTGGGAAALAAGLTPLEIGSDIGGSIRVPAAFCGVYGHRPSETALPRSGHVPGSPLPNVGVVLKVLGPLARDAADLALAMRVTAGSDVGEDVAWRLALPPARHERLADYRVAVLPPLHWQPVQGEIWTALEDLVRQLSVSGTRVEEAQPDAFGDLREHHRLYMQLLAAMFAYEAAVPENRARGMADAATATGDEFYVAYGRGLLATAHEFLDCLQQRERYRAAFRTFFRRWDILLAPVTITPAFPHDDAPFRERRLEVDGRMFDHFRLAVYPGVATLSGQPATAFPVGCTRSGLPIGLQAIGPYLEDATSIHFAGLLAEAFGGFRRPPGYESAG